MLILNGFMHGHKNGPYLWRQVSGGLDRGLDSLHGGLVGRSHGGCLFRCGPQLIGVGLEVSGSIVKHLRRAQWNGAIMLLAGEVQSTVYSFCLSIDLSREYMSFIFYL